MSEQTLAADGLTVDSDVYSLNVRVDIIDSRAFVNPCLLFGDGGDFQQLII